jgi:hypothetical protein
MTYVATINVPGYLPMDDDPPEFDTAREAWEWLAQERQAAEEDADIPEWSETQSTLRLFADGSPGTGVVYGTTPGYDGDHDLGLVYSVTQL